MKYYKLCRITDRESHRMIVLPTQSEELDSYLCLNDTAECVGDTEPRRFELPPADLLEFRAKGPQVEDLPMSFYSWILSDRLVQFIDRMQPGVLRRTPIRFDASTPERLKGDYWYAWCDLEIECHDQGVNEISYIGDSLHVHNMVIDPSRVPKDVHFFRPRFQHRSIIISSKFIASAKREKLVGVRYY
jgi:hypothetical protein